MLVRKTSVMAVTALMIGLVGCGGGSSNSSSEGDSNTDPNMENTDEGSDPEDILTGIFVDSAVAGASYATATQSGTTSSAGEFSYIAGEQVTFSIGATELPTIDAAAQVSPVDMGAGNSATTTNIARLLQSLDDDGNPDNGITIPATAAASAGTINFNVSESEFANDTAVINLVANSGSVNTALISSEDAILHLNETLGINNTENTEGNNDNALAAFAGFYDSTMNSDFQHYLLINADGTSIEYEDREENVEQCFNTEAWTFVSLGGNVFRVEREGRDPDEVNLSIQGNDLLVGSPLGSFLLPQVTTLTPADLPICG